MPNSDDINKPLIGGCASGSRYCTVHAEVRAAQPAIVSRQSSRQHATNVQNSIWPATTMEFACHVTIMVLLALTQHDICTITCAAGVPPFAVYRGHNCLHSEHGTYRVRNSGGWRFIDSTAHNKQRVSGGPVEFIHGNDVQRGSSRNGSASHSVLSVSVFG